MQTALLLSSFLMGVAGTPHCATMCGAASAGITGVGSRPGRGVAFHGGRIAGYSLAGALVAATAGLLADAAGAAAMLRPFWVMLHVAIVLLGMTMLWRGRQPQLFDRIGHHVWQAVRSRTLGVDTRTLPFVAGLIWTLLPCGLLYSALAVAAVADSAAVGALAMALFAVGSAAGLAAAPLLWRLARSHFGAGSTALALRIAGALLAATSGWAVFELLAGHQHSLFCDH